MFVGQVPCILIKGMDFLQTFESLATSLYAEGGMITFSRDISTLACQATTHILNPLAEPSISTELPMSYVDLITMGEMLSSPIFSEENLQDRKVLKCFGDPKTLQDFQVPSMISKIRSRFGEDQYKNIVDAFYQDPSKRDFRIYFQEEEEDDCRLQLLEFRLVPNNANQIQMYVTAHWSSMELWRYWFVSAYTLYDFSINLARDLREVSGKEVIPGRFTTFTNFLYLNTSDEIASRLREMQTTSYLQRAFTYKAKDRVVIEKEVMGRFTTCQKILDDKSEKPVDISIDDLTDTAEKVAVVPKYTGKSPTNPKSKARTPKKSTKGK